MKTAYGWHIIRLQEKRGIAPFEDARVDIKSRIERTSQYSELRNDYVSKVKQTYKFMEYPDNIAAVAATLDSTFLNNEWSADKAKGMDKPVFTIGSKTYTQDDLAITLQVKQRTSRDRDIQGKFRSIYEASRDNMLIEYDMSARNEDFRRLMQGVPRRYSAVRPAGTESMDRSCAGIPLVWKLSATCTRATTCGKKGWTPAFISALTLLLPKGCQKNGEEEYCR